MLGAMRFLSYAYAAVLLTELVGLSVLYATDAPASSDPLSIDLGWAAIASMVVMLVYSVARRSRGLRRVARLSGWLQFHIFLGLQGVLFAFFHSFHLFAKMGRVMVANPGLLAYLAVLVVFCSGLFGRYLYSWLPRAMGGEQLALRDVDAELAALGTVPDEVRALWSDTPPVGGFSALIAANRRRRAALASLSGMELAADVRSLAARRLDLEHKKAMLASAERVFRNWIVLHRPLAAILYVLVLVHVALSYMFTPSLGR